MIAEKFGRFATVHKPLPPDLTLFRPDQDSADQPFLDDRNACRLQKTRPTPPCLTLFPTTNIRGIHDISWAVSGREKGLAS